MKRIILGSASPRRRELLRLMGVEFEVMVSGEEEHYHGTFPQDVVKELALAKAEGVARLLDEEALHKVMDNSIPAVGTESQSVVGAASVPEPCLVIGADTVVVKDGKILGKPKDEGEAFAMLRTRWTPAWPCWNLPVVSCMCVPAMRKGLGFSCTGWAMTRYARTFPAGRRWTRPARMGYKEGSRCSLTASRETITTWSGCRWHICTGN